MTEMVKCPVEGCDYGPKPKQSVLGHYSGKSDGQHPGGYQKAKSLLEPGSDAQPKPDPEPEPEPSREAQPAAETSADGSRGENPTMGSAEAVTEPEPAARREQRQQDQEKREARRKQMQEAGDDPVCLRCGGELFDFRQFDSGQYHQVNGHSVFVAGDFQCSSCGRWWDDE